MKMTNTKSTFSGFTSCNLADEKQFFSRINWTGIGLRHGGGIVNKFSTEMDLTVEFEIYFSQLLDFISVWILFSSDIGAVCSAQPSEFKE